MRECSPLLLDLKPEDPGILVTQSIHKQQAGFSQTSQIHKKDSHLRGQKRYVDHKRFNNAYMLYASTSPFYPLFAALDVNARMQDGEAGRKLWADCIKVGVEARKDVLERCELLKPFIPPVVNGKLWQDYSTEEIANNIEFFKFYPGEKWHSFEGYGENQYFVDPNKFMLTTPGINVETGEYEDFGIPATILANYLKEATLASDLPLMADIDSSLYLFSKEVRKHATVVLSGECADEVFGGYPWYTKDYENIEMFPWQDSLNHRKNILAKSIADLPIEEYAKQMCQDSIKKVPKVKGESKRDERMRELTYLNLKWFMITLLNRKDRMTMANSLEGRVPYADKTLVEYAYNIPADMKLLHGREKGLLRESMRTLLPDEIIDRKKSPYPKTHNPIYTKAVCKMLNDIAQDPNAKLFQIVDKEAVINMINTQGRSFTKPWFGQLMTGPQVIAYLIQLETWLNEYNVKLDI